MLFLCVRLRLYWCGTYYRYELPSLGCLENYPKETEQKIPLLRAIDVHQKGQALGSLESRCLVKGNGWSADSHMVEKRERIHKASGVSFTGSWPCRPPRFSSSHTKISAAVCQLGEHSEAQFMAFTDTHKVILLLMLKSQFRVLKKPLKISPFISIMPGWHYDLMPWHCQLLTLSVALKPSKQVPFFRYTTVWDYVTRPP